MSCTDTKPDMLAEMKALVPQLSTENKRRLLRLLRHILASDGFSEEFNSFLDENGGPEAVGLKRAESFIDAWEVLHRA